MSMQTDSQPEVAESVTAEEQQLSECNEEDEEAQPLNEVLLLYNFFQAKYELTAVE